MLANILLLLCLDFTSFLRQLQSHRQQKDEQQHEKIGISWQDYQPTSMSTISKGVSISERPREESLAGPRDLMSRLAGLSAKRLVDRNRGLSSSRDPMSHLNLLPFGCRLAIYGHNTIHCVPTLFIWIFFLPLIPPFQNSSNIKLYSIVTMRLRRLEDGGERKGEGRVILVVFY